MDRREFLQLGAAAVAVTAAGRPARAVEAAKPVRVGVIGTGGRGTGLLGLLLAMDGVQVPAVCDIDRGRLGAAQQMVVKSGRPEPEGYWKSEDVFRDMLRRDDLDAVVIATPWKWHTPGGSRWRRPPAGTAAPTIWSCGSWSKRCATRRSCR